MRANSQIWKILASRRLGTKSLVGRVWTLTLFPEDKTPPYPAAGGGIRRRSIISWARLGATFLVSSRRIGRQELRPRRAECFYISTNSINRKRKVARLGHKMSDFAICELVDRWHQKKRMENSQMRNPQIAIAEIWDTLFRDASSWVMLVVPLLNSSISGYSATPKY